MHDNTLHNLFHCSPSLSSVGIMNNNEIIVTNDNYRQEQTQKKNTYFTTRLLLLCIGIGFTIISIVSVLPARNSPTAIPTARAASVQFIHITQHHIAEILSPVGWVSFGTHLSVAAHVDLKITYMDKVHFIAVWFHYICCIYHCICIGSFANLSFVLIPAVILLPIYFHTTAIRKAIRASFYKRAKDESNFDSSNIKGRLKLETFEGQVVVENLMRAFTIVGGMTFLLSEVTECLQGIYTKSKADAKCSNIFMNNYVILTVMSQVFLYKVLLIDTGSTSITNAVRCNAKTKTLTYSNTLVGLCVLQVFVLFSVRHLLPSDLGFIFSLLFAYMPMITMPINLFIVVKVIKSNFKTITENGSGSGGFINNIRKDNLMMMTNDSEVLSTNDDNIKDIERNISEKETTIVTSSGGSKQTKSIISSGNSNSKYVVE